MKIAVASGKGGTGKTTVSASLARVWDTPLLLADLDVEEPNLHLFVSPGKMSKLSVYSEVPRLDFTMCTSCGRCAEFCQFKAISMLGERITIFPEMCHACGGCILLCPEKALGRGKRELGTISWGEIQSGNQFFIMGRLRVGEAMSPPLMRAVQKHSVTLLSQSPRDVLIDAPPGVSCPAVNAVMDSDCILLVTEPTPFGLHDLRLAVQAFRPLKKTMAVLVNRAGIGDQAVFTYCRDENLPVLASIPFDRGFAEAYSQGRCLADISSSTNALFSRLRDDLRLLFASKEPDRA